MELTDLAEPPLPHDLRAVSRASLEAWDTGRRRDVLNLAAVITTSLDEMGNGPKERFSVWLCERLFDGGDGWWGQFGGGLSLQDGQYYRPIEYALSVNTLTSRVVVPHVLRGCDDGDSRTLRWLWQCIVGLGFRLQPDVRSDLDTALRTICGPQATPVDALRRAAVADERARTWLRDLERGDTSRPQ